MRLRGLLPESVQTRGHSSPLTGASRLVYLRITLAAAYVSGILLSLRLWFGVGRSFPRLPLVNGVPAFYSSAEYLLSILVLAALVLSVFSRLRRYPVAVVVLAALLVLFDLTRLQPWVYQYVLMLGVLACLKPTEANSDETEVTSPILAANQLIVAFLYFWSGTQKLNWTFRHEVLPRLLESTGIHLPAAFLSYLPAVGVAIAGGEALIGLALMIRRTRRTAVVFAVGLHFMVLILLLVARRNSVVWPWNLAMITMVVLLFWRYDLSLASKEIWRWRVPNLASHLPQAAVLICGLVPALSFVGWWDIYLSGALYSGNTPVAVVRITDRVREQLPIVAQQQIFKTGRGELMLPFYEWSLADLNVPPYPEVRAYRQLARRLCAYADDQAEIELIVKERPSLIDGSYRVNRFGCPDLP